MEEISLNATSYLGSPPFLFDTGIMEEISAELVRKQKKGTRCFYFSRFIPLSVEAGEISMFLLI